MINKILLLCCCISCTNVIKSQNMERTDLSDFWVDSQQVNKIEVKEVRMEAGARAPYHMHPCNVVGYVVSGTVLYQKQGDELQVLKAGDVFYEPKDAPISHFDNESDSEPLIFVAYYLLDGDESLLKILNKPI